MEILVDYDNLDHNAKRLGMLFLADRCLHLSYQVTSIQFSRARLKIYGGWYENKSMTQRAQSVSADLAKEFPTVTNVTRSSMSSFPVVTSAELAYSTEANPRKHLFHTYRRQLAPKDIKCYSPTRVGCTDQNCDMKLFYSIMQAKKCPNPSCDKSINDYLYKGAQKLVDSMLVADIIHHAYNGVKVLCVVSSDDDFWPAIESALIAGCSVVHVHTKQNFTTKSDYCANVAGNYMQCNL